MTLKASTLEAIMKQSNKAQETHLLERGLFTRILCVKLYQAIVEKQRHR